MFEMMNKLNEVAREIFEVVPRERLKKLSNKVLVKPLQRAMKKIDKPEAAQPIQEAIEKFLNEFTPDTMAMLAFATIAKADNVEKISEYAEILDDFVELKPEFEKYVSVIEKHALAIGRIVERTIVLWYSIKADLEENDE